LRLAFGWDHPSLRTELFGRDLLNPIGLAAGFDKDARGLDALAALGFGLIEAGTVTPRPQPGNPRPRIFRLAADEALINRLGFNSAGCEDVFRRLREVSARCWVGVNLGKNRDTPNERAAGDYLTGLRAVPAGVAFAAINVSSPNTPGLRALQRRDSLRDLLSQLVAERDRIARGSTRLPLLAKLSPDLSAQELADAAEVALETGLDGLIATNTTVSRPDLHSPHRDEQGGLSGRPLRPMALTSIRELHRLTAGRIPLIGVGGIFSSADAYAMIRAGASAVQIYTGLIYRGPGLVKQIKQGLVLLLERDGFSNVREAVGAGS
jgi:dihydroorotate dehydrogenase